MRIGSLQVENYECPAREPGERHVLENFMVTEDDCETACVHCGVSWGDLDELARHVSGLNRERERARDRREKKTETSIQETA